MMRRYLTLLTVLTTLLALTTPAFTQTVLFGPKQYTRTAGPPNQFTDTFTLPSGTTPPYTLHVVNGNANGTNRISSATVTLNGTQILGPSDFGQNVAVIDRTITPQASNTLEIRLTSAPGSFITLTVLDTSAGSQPTALTPNPLNLNAGATGTLTAMLAPAPTAAGSLTVSSANPAVATVPASVSFTSGQTSVPVTVTAVASGSTTITVSLNGASAASQVTVMPPPPTIISFMPTSGTVGTTVTITGTDFINVQSVTLNGSAAIFTINNATTITAVVPSGATTGKIVIAGSAGTATSATNFMVLVSSVVTSFTPTSGPVGITVTITGQNFDPIASNNTVKVNGKLAIIASANSATIVTTIPQGATSGVISVTTPINTATSGEQFIVQATQDFILSVAPALPVVGTVIQGGQVTFALTVSPPPGRSFTGLVGLGAVGLPSGVTAQFSGPTLTSGQTGFVTLTVGGSVSPGTVSFNITGSAQLEAGPVTRMVPGSVQVLASGGQTALSGQVLRTDGAPIPNVLMKIIGTSLEARTDAAGHFLIQNTPSGAQQLMVNANEAVAGYPIYHTDLVLTAGQISTFPTIWITPPPPAERFTTLNNAAITQIITDPRFPGAEFTIPAGVTIVGWDGALKTKIAMERLSPEKLPVPPPPGPTKSIFQIFFGTPMGGQPSASIPVTLPNDLDLDPGDQAELWYYDASPLGGPGIWKLAGMGTVSLDGKKIVSDPGVGIQRFCGVCGLPCFINRQQKQPNVNPNGPNGGDPVDLGTGTFTVGMTDLVLPGRFPVVLARKYNPFDPFGTIGGFQPLLGPGWSLSVDPIMLPNAGLAFQTPDLIRLILPGNTRLDLTKQPNGTYSNSTHPLLRGAVLTLSGNTSNSISDLRFKDGSTWRFSRRRFGASAFFDVLIEMRDRNGNITTIEREPNGQKIL